MLQQDENVVKGNRTSKGVLMPRFACRDLRADNDCWFVGHMEGHDIWYHCSDSCVIARNSDDESETKVTDVAMARQFKRGVTGRAMAEIDKRPRLLQRNDCRFSGDLWTNHMFEL